jgi:glutathione S-transferase
MYRVYGDIRSGNFYKVKLLMHHLDTPHEWVKVDVLTGETKTPEHLARNPNGRIPVLELPTGQFLWESNAILNYLAKGTEYLPEDRWLHATVLQWQFFEQNSHEPFIAGARFVAKFLGLPDELRADFESKQEKGKRALEVMEQQLSRTDYLVGDALTIADISFYAYTHIADEGGFDLAGFPAIRRWIGRVSSHPRHLGMADAAAG